MKGNKSQTLSNFLRVCKLGAVDVCVSKWGFMCTCVCVCVLFSNLFYVSFLQVLFDILVQGLVFRNDKGINVGGIGNRNKKKKTIVYAIIFT